jgi:mRNA-degrading endonuclease HigB of HigAB toxin-antitoxin module
MNESQNYFHKPLFNLNWYSQLAETFSLYTTVYWSGGQGGGTGTFGSLNYDFSLLQRVVNWDSTIEENRGNIVFDDPYGTGDSSSYAISTDRRNDPIYNRSGILRNSVNSQWTVGAISKAYIKASNELNLSFGIDVRTAEIDHYREVRDLLGNDFYHFNGNEFESGTDYFKQLGDHIDYDNTNTVKWLGGFVQGEYTKGKYTLYGNAGYSTIKFDYTDHFHKASGGGEVFLESDWISGYQFKGGASYRVSPEVQLYVNGGYVLKVPIFDQVISDADRSITENPLSEKFISFEAGANTNLLQNKLSLSANVYYTTWSDRADTRSVMNADGTEGLVRLDGISSRHMGAELEGAWQPVRFIRFNLAGSYGIWEYTEDVSGEYIVDRGSGVFEEFNFFINELKVGDAPQFQIAASFSIFPVPGMQAQLLWRHYDNYYSDFDPFSRNDPDDRAQVWQIPAYNLLDFNFAYALPAQILGLNVSIFAHIFNLANNLYVQDAVDNSQFNGWSVDGTDHKADDAEIYPGLPTTFNLGFSAAL